MAGFIIIMGFHYHGFFHQMEFTKFIFIIGYQYTDSDYEFFEKVCIAHVLWPKLSKLCMHILFWPRSEKVDL